MRLPLRIQKLLFVMAACMCLAGIGLVINWALNDEPNWALTSASNKKPSISKVIESPAIEAKHDEFAQFWNLPLRRPLYDPPPAKPEVRQLPPLRVELAGTIIEPPNSVAIIRSEQGRTEYKRIGDIVGPSDSPGRIAEIRVNEIVVERNEERFTVGMQTRELR